MHLVKNLVILVVIYNVLNAFTHSRDICNMDFIPIESVLYQIRSAEGKPFTLTYFSIRSKVRKTKKFLYRAVRDLKGEGTISLTDPSLPDVPQTIKIGLMIEFNQQKIKH